MHILFGFASGFTMNVFLFVSKRSFRAALVFSAVLLGQIAHAADNVKYLNDWRWEGPAAPLLMAMQTTFPKANLNVSATPGTGSAATIAKVATGEFDIGLGDFSSLVEFAAKNPTVAPPVAVYVLYERNPSTLFIRSASGAKSPQQLGGKKLGAPVFDGGRKLWPAYAALNDIPAVKWENVDAAKRESAFAAGEVDAITGFYFTTILNLEAKGVSGRDYTAHRFYEAGLRVYGNVIMVNPAYLKANGKVVTNFVRALHGAVKSTIRDTDAAVKYVKAQEPTSDERLEWRRARLAIDQFIVTPGVNEDGLGTIDMKRVESGIKLVVDALKLPATPAAAAIASTEYLPVLADRKL
jgi:NitT/TauT family transport system substrate-binding protein